MGGKVERSFDVQFLDLGIMDFKVNQSDLFIQ